MPGLRAPQVIHRLRETRPDLRVLVLTAYDDNELVFGLLEAGAVGYVLKEEALETIKAAVRAVARGEPWLSPWATPRGRGSRVRPCSMRSKATQPS